MDGGDSFPKQEVEEGGSPGLIHVTVTESKSAFNQRALVSHEREGRVPKSVISSRRPHQMLFLCLTSCSLLSHIHL